MVDKLTLEYVCCFCGYAMRIAGAHPGGHYDDTHEQSQAMLLWGACLQTQAFIRAIYLCTPWHILSFVSIEPRKKQGPHVKNDAEPEARS